MYAKIRTGKDAGGLVRYLTGKGSGLVDYMTGDGHDLGAIIYRNLAATTPPGAAAEMRFTASRSRRVHHPYLHVIASWHARGKDCPARHIDERPSEEQMIAAVDGLLQRLGLEDRQAVYAIHLEKDHLHIHAAVNRIGAEGRAWDTWQMGERARNACRSIEHELGFINGDEYLLEHRRAVPTAQQQRIAAKSGIPPDLGYAEALAQRKADGKAFAQEILQPVRAALRANSWTAVHTALAEHELGAREIVSNKNPTRRGLEIVHLKSGRRCPASELGSDYGRAALVRRLGPFRAGPHAKNLEALRAVARPLRYKRRDSELWLAYNADRSRRRADWGRALDRQRAADRDRRAEVRRKFARLREDVRARLRGTTRKAELSKVAHAYAAAREKLQREIRAERDELVRITRARSWTEFVVERARDGEALAREQVQRWQRRGVVLEIHPPAGHKPTAPAVPMHTIENLSYSVDHHTGDVAYRWGDRIAIIDRGPQIDVFRTEDAAIRAGLELARSKWGNTVLLIGTSEFQRHASMIATELGISVKLGAEIEPRADLETPQALRHEPAQPEIEPKHLDAVDRDLLAEEERRRQERDAEFVHDVADRRVPGTTEHQVAKFDIGTEPDRLIVPDASDHAAVLAAVEEAGRRWGRVDVVGHGAFCVLVTRDLAPAAKIEIGNVDVKPGECALIRGRDRQRDQELVPVHDRLPEHKWEMERVNEMELGR